ncbi:MAG: FAD-dependent oxidoreductase [Deltaproteobacteria bacterium]|nr:FAD-dependent oxidoreductase [Deltaproteobacteria bacterium]
MKYECIIVGGGPAALAAALRLNKAGRQVVMVAKGNPASAAEPWLQSLKEQTQNIQTIPEEVVQATLGATEKKVATKSDQVLEAAVLILASGCFDRQGFIEGEEKFVGRGVFYNAYQDGPSLAGKTLIVEGKTEQALREVLYLSRHAGKIYFIVPAMRLEGDSRLTECLQKEPKVEILLSASLKKIEGNETPQTAVVLSAGSEKAIAADAVFLYARRSRPQYDYLRGTVEISEEGCVLVDETFMTSIPGVFACGDMIAGQPQLPFVSAAQGMIAAMSADRWLNLNE